MSSRLVGYSDLVNVLSATRNKVDNIDEDLLALGIDPEGLLDFAIRYTAVNFQYIRDRLEQDESTKLTLSDEQAALLMSVLTSLITRCISIGIHSAQSVAVERALNGDG